LFYEVRGQGQGGGEFFFIVSESGKRGFRERGISGGTVTNSDYVDLFDVGLGGEGGLTV